MVTNSRYAFLGQLHAVLQPRGYLEIGVQAGGSLALARCPSVGIDPNPLVASTELHHIFKGTSDQFFESGVDPEDWQQTANWLSTVDLAFIDGMHLFEYALRDFMNVERHSHPDTVIVFDDVLPYSNSIATRTQPPGDWTGDVWKVEEILWEYRPDLKRVLVDTYPTGALVVWNVDPASEELSSRWDEIMERRDWQGDIPVPDSVLLRSRAVPASAAIEMILEGRS